MNNVEKSHAFNLVLKISLLFFLPLVTAWLYYIGLAYYSSYIEFWGLDIGLFPLSIAEGMRHGGYVLVTLGIKAIAGGLVTIISLTGFIAATYLIVDYILRLKIFQGVPKEISIGNASQKSPARDQLSTLMMQLMTGVAGIAIGYGVLLITVFTLYLSHNFSVDCSGIVNLAT